MREVTVYHYDAFTGTPGKGNPAGIVLHADGLPEEQMQKIAHKVGFNETAFVVRSDRADLRIRYFTPGHEMDLCGHGTIASIACLLDQGELDGGRQIRIETRAGILPVSVGETDRSVSVQMCQAAPSFLDYHGIAKELAQVLGLREEDIDASLPVVYGSTGTWTLLVPVRSLEAFFRMRPLNARFPEVLREKPTSSIHPFCFQTVWPDCGVHARHFSSPFSGTVEDPVTGTASGVIAAYILTHVHPEKERLEMAVEQGFEIGREGKVYIHAKKQGSHIDVAISGTAVFSGLRRIEIG